MRTLFSLCLIVSSFWIWSCARANGRADTRYDNRNVTNQATRTPPLDNSASDVTKFVVFDGKNYLKKSGWTIPSRDETRIESKKNQKLTTEKGKEVEATRFHYVHKTARIYSEDFHYDGRDLDFMKGNLKSRYFLEESANGNVFFYSIFVEKLIPPAVSNSDPHEDAFSYQIMDSDGDGIFETLLGPYDEIIVPAWVLSEGKHD